jgi:hypothetical protein
MLKIIYSLHVYINMIKMFLNIIKYRIVRVKRKKISCMNISIDYLPSIHGLTSQDKKQNMWNNSINVISRNFKKKYSILNNPVR